MSKILDDGEDIKITKKDYKSKVDKILQTKFDEEETVNNKLNLLDFNRNKQNEKKVPMSIYFKEEDLILLKAISQFNNTTVNKTLMRILKDPIMTTRDNLPSDFDIEELASQYEKRSRKRNSKND